METQAEYTKRATNLWKWYRTVAKDVIIVGAEASADAWRELTGKTRTQVLESPELVDLLHFLHAQFLACESRHAPPRSQQRRQQAQRQQPQRRPQRQAQRQPRRKQRSKRSPSPERSRSPSTQRQRSPSPKRKRSPSPRSHLAQRQRSAQRSAQPRNVTRAAQLVPPVEIQQTEADFANRARKLWDWYNLVRNQQATHVGDSEVCDVWAKLAAVTRKKDFIADKPLVEMTNLLREQYLDFTDRAKR